MKSVLMMLLRRTYLLATGAVCRTLNAAAVLVHGVKASVLARNAAAVLALGFLIATVAIAGIWVSVVRVTPGSIGVKQRNWGLSSGLEGADLEPGLHAAPRGWSSIHQLDNRVRIASFGFKSEGANLPALEVRTLDGNTPKIHAQVVFRLRAGEGHQVMAAGLKSAWEARVQSRIEKVLFDEFSRITSDHLMDAEQLGVVASIAMNSLNRELRSLHSEADHVLVNGVYFPASYEGKLREKQLESQAIRTDRSLAKRSRMKTENALIAHRLETENLEVAWEADRQIEEMRLDLELSIAQEARNGVDENHTRGLEAENAYQQMHADGELALARADARRQQLLGRALEGPGGKLLVAKEVAESLNIEHLELDSNSASPWLDIDEWLMLLVGPE